MFEVGCQLLGFGISFRFLFQVFEAVEAATVFDGADNSFIGNDYNGGWGSAVEGRRCHFGATTGASSPDSSGGFDALSDEGWARLGFYFLTGLDPFVEHMLNIVLIWVFLDSIRVFGLRPFQVGFVPNGCP